MHKHSLTHTHTHTHKYIKQHELPLYTRLSSDFGARLKTIKGKKMQIYSYINKPIFIFLFYLISFHFQA